MKIKLGLEQMSMLDVGIFCGGVIHGDKSTKFSYVCTDSREADKDTLFVATRGERVDGHTFIKSAQDLGCTCFLCEYIPDDVRENSSFCVVENSLGGFSCLAKGYKNDSKTEIIAITGSTGKTTTKTFTSLVLSEAGEVYSTKGNFNSVIGMPMSLMEMSGDVSRAVIEMGMSGFSEIHSMSVTARPKIAVITNIGSSHLEYLKTRENIAKAKYEIADGLRKGGTLLLNGDEPLLRDIADRTQAEYSVKYVSLEGNGDYLVQNVLLSKDGSRFDFTGDGVSIKDIFLPAIGMHVVFDAAFAVAVGVLCGLDGEQIKRGLAKYVPDAYRQRIYTHNGITIISDCYNAAPESVKGALSILSRLECERKIAVLGDMKELGEDSAQMHRTVGEFAAACGVDMLFLMGELAHNISLGAEDGGIKPDNIFLDRTNDHALFAENIKKKLRCGDVVLFKASRSMKFEKIIEKITE